MIKLLETPSVQTAKKLLSALSDSVHTVYTLLPLLDISGLEGVWIQTDEASRPIAVLVKPNCSFLRIAAEENADFPELRAFTDTFNKVFVQASPAVFRNLGITVQAQHRLMALEAEAAPTRTAAYIYDDFRPLYDLVVRTLPTSPDSLPENVQEKLYKEWLSRTARGVFGGFTRVAAAYTEDNDLAATAFADILEDFAYLREVACVSAYRKQGYASSCVRTLCTDLRKDGIHHIFLSCDAENETFYQKSGFQKCADLELGFLTR